MYPSAEHPIIFLLKGLTISNVALVLADKTLPIDKKQGEGWGGYD